MKTSPNTAGKGFVIRQPSWFKAMLDAFLTRETEPERRQRLSAVGRRRHKDYPPHSNKKRGAARAAHVARVREQSVRELDYFLQHGTKPPRKLRLKWAKEIARDVAAA